MRRRLVLPLLAAALLAPLLVARAAESGSVGVPAERGEADKAARTIDLLLHMQTPAASAPGGVLRYESRSQRAQSPAQPPADRGRFAGPPGHTTLDSEQNAAASTEIPEDVRASLPPPKAQRSHDSLVTASDDPAVDTRDLLPVKILRFVRENREIAIGVAIGVLILAAVAGAAAGGAGGRQALGGSAAPAVRELKRRRTRRR